MIPVVYSSFNTFYNPEKNLFTSGMALDGKLFLLLLPGEALPLRNTVAGLD